MFGLTTRAKKALTPKAEYPLRWLPEEFSTLFNRMFNSWPMMIEEPEWESRWELTIEEKEKEYLVKAEMPGFEPNEVKVELLGERLTIEAEHKEPAEKEKEEKKERVYAHVKRVITLPPGIEAEKIEAVYRNGVLEVKIPRVPEAVGRKGVFGQGRDAWL